MKKFLFIVSLLCPYVLFAQAIEGTVTDKNQQPLVGASVFWLNTTTGTMTDEHGQFSIKSIDPSHQKLVATYMGYFADTITINNQKSVNFELQASKVLDEVVVSDQRDGVIMSNLTPIKTQQITRTELGKSACCDLAGCFETQIAIQPQTTNVVTNAKELRILGLSGVYNQVLVNGLPMIQGLSYTYGISSIPGTLVENISISKGANSVLQGFESISGQINVATLKPSEADKFFFNAYVNSFSEKQLNTHFSLKKGKWSNLTAVHAVFPANDFDRDGDQFLDVPKIRRYLISNDLQYGNERDWGWHSRVGLRYVDEQRVGGQVNFNEKTDQGSTAVYGQLVNMQQPEVWTKTGFRLNDQHHFVLMASSFHQDQNAYFGTVKYDAQQTNFYGNVQYELNYADHSLKTGFSYRHLNLSEQIDFTENTLNRTYDGHYLKDEHIAGGFIENTLKLFDGKLTWLAGVRMDHHNQFGWMFTPRTLLKYDVSPNSVIRANVGTGWRTANIFSENINLLASSRNVIFSSELKPEQALNTGLNFTQKFENDQASGFVSADLYRTDFNNQIFPDYDSSPTEARIENFDGKSVSNAFQLEFFVKLWQQFEFKTGYRYLDVYREIEGEKVALPFNPQHKTVTTLGYKPLSQKYHIDMNIHWYDRQRLPNTQSNPVEFQRPDYSDPFTTVNMQFTYNFKEFEFYGGCENIFDFRQKQPIVGWQDPFGPYFDTSSVWGPTRGREFYVGMRFRVP